MLLIQREGCNPDCINEIENARRKGLRSARDHALYLKVRITNPK